MAIEPRCDLLVPTGQQDGVGTRSKLKASRLVVPLDLFLFAVIGPLLVLSVLGRHDSRVLRVSSRGVAAEPAGRSVFADAAGGAVKGGLGLRAEHATAWSVTGDEPQFIKGAGPSVMFRIAPAAGTLTSGRNFRPVRNIVNWLVTDSALWVCQQTSTGRKVLGFDLRSARPAESVGAAPEVCGAKPAAPAPTSSVSLFAGQIAGASATIVTPDPETPAPMSRLLGSQIRHLLRKLG